jgi:hypothetical protein
MTAPITEAHRKLATELCRNATGSNRALHHVPKFAQLIADSEARTCDQLRARCDQLITSSELIDLAFLEQSARAERAEAELATERARLDFLSKRDGAFDHIRWGDYRHYWGRGFGSTREIIDAAMKGGREMNFVSITTVNKNKNE